MVKIVINYSIFRQIMAAKLMYDYDDDYRLSASTWLGILDGIHSIKMRLHIQYKAIRLS